MSIDLTPFSHKMAVFNRYLHNNISIEFNVKYPLEEKKVNRIKFKEENAINERCELTYEMRIKNGFFCFSLPQFSFRIFFLLFSVMFGSQ